jgi:hypothetical protein
MLLLLALGLPAVAHPGVGIVIDSRGNVFYTDLKQIWMIDRAGHRTVAIPNVHSHELAIDAQDNLYGEHLLYNGEAVDTWGSRVWRRSPDGKITDVVPAHPGFNDEYSLVRDAAGNMYFAVRDKGEIRRRTPRGEISTIARGQFRDIRWMTVTSGGTVYLVDSLDVVEVLPSGAIRTVAKNLSAPPLIHADGSERHRVMGIWMGRDGNIYVADHAGRSVKRVTPQGKVTIVMRSPWPWSPTGGTFDRDGNLWVLEDTLLSVRARRFMARSAL